MSEGKNQHYVPQFYFKRFSSDDSIQVLVRNKGFVPDRAASISGQASKDFFYGDASVEKQITAFEGRAATAIRQLGDADSPAELEGENVRLIWEWLAFQRYRTLAARQAMKAMGDWLQGVAKIMAQEGSETSRESNAAAIVENIAELGPANSQIVAMNTAVEGAGFLSDLAPLLLHNRTERPFIFGDSPVIFYNLARHSVAERGALGFRSPGLLIFYPLSERKMLLLVDRYLYRIDAKPGNQIFVRDLADVAALNKLQIHAAAAAVYFVDPKLSNYVRDLWEQERDSLIPHKGVTHEAPGYSSETGKPIGNVFHAYERQIPMKLNLSFLAPYNDRRSQEDLRRNSRDQR